MILMMLCSLIFGSQQLLINDRDSGKNNTLILDLDETLGESRRQSEWEVRPYFCDLIKAAQHWELITWSAATSWYGKARIKLLEDYVAKKCHFSIEFKFEYSFYREHCDVNSDGQFIKDLRKLVNDNRPLESMLMVDDLPKAVVIQPPTNVYQIQKRRDCDRDLLHISLMLKYLEGKQIGAEVLPPFTKAREAAKKELPKTKCPCCPVQ